MGSSSNRAKGPGPSMLITLPGYAELTCGCDARDEKGGKRDPDHPWAETQGSRVVRLYHWSGRLHHMKCGRLTKLVKKVPSDIEMILHLADVNDRFGQAQNQDESSKGVHATLKETEAEWRAALAILQEVERRLGGQVSYAYQWFRGG